MITQGDLCHNPNRSRVAFARVISGQAFVGEWPGHSNEPRQAVESHPRWLSRVDSNSRDRYPPKSVGAVQQSITPLPSDRQSRLTQHSTRNPRLLFDA